VQTTYVRKEGRKMKDVYTYLGKGKAIAIATAK